MAFIVVANYYFTFVADFDKIDAGPGMRLANYFFMVLGLN